MRKLALSIIFTFAASNATPAIAATKWIASYGSGSTCSRSAPCGGPFGAVSAANDVLHCVDSGQYSNLSIIYAFSMICEGVDASMQFLQFNNIPANQVAFLEGITFDCDGYPMKDGIKFTGAGTLRLHNVKIRNCANGLVFATSGAAKLEVTDSSFDNNSGSGISIAPTADTAQVSIRNSTFQNNAANGILVQAPTGTKAFVSLEKVNASGNQTGLRSGGPGSKVTSLNGAFTNNVNGVFAYGRVDLTDTAASNNTVGVNAAENADVTLARSRIFGNGTGLKNTGGNILTFGNNEVNGNTTDGAPTAAALPLK